MKETRIAFLNGKFVAEEQAAISIFDRGFLYGDGLFSTIRVCHGRPFRWRRHLLRLKRGAELLHLQIPTPEEELRELAIELSRRNNLSDSILRLTVSRGVGPRGYSPAGANNPTITMTVHPRISAATPLTWRLGTSNLRLNSADALGSLKSCNRLLQVTARAAAEAEGFDEALLLNDQGYAVETTSANLFWLEEDAVCTSPLGSGILPGVTRSVLFEICENLGRRVVEHDVTRDQLLGMNGVFASLSSLGVVEITAVDNHPLSRSEFVPLLRGAYEKLVNSETASDSVSAL